MDGKNSQEQLSDMAKTIRIDSAFKVKACQTVDVSLIPAELGAFVINKVDGLLYYADVDGWKQAAALIPAKDKALFWLNGVLKGEQFADMSGNGRNFDIQNRDFDANYFPYKSAATISAPPGDTDLIAADVNNFLYTGGVPNEIPVVSFFQNIDYENKLFTRHIPQVVDANGVETTEPSVVDIVLYSEALSGDEEAEAFDFYGVPAEVTGAVKWVSKDGNDTTGDGSKLNPWLTLTKAEVSATNGDTIYVKSGAYDEVNFWQPRYDRTWIAIGGVTVTSTGTSYVLINSQTNSVHITGFVLDGEGNTTSSAYITSDTSLIRCLFKGAITNQILTTTGSVISISNCVILGGGSLESSTSLNTCLLNLGDTLLLKRDGSEQLFTNSKINIINDVDVGIYLNNSNSITFLGCAINIVSCTRGMQNVTAKVGNGVVFDYCTITQTSSVISGIHFSANVGDIVQVSNSTIINNTTTNVFTLSDQSAVDVNDNFISSNYAYSIRIITQTVATIVSVKTNFISANHETGYGISVGNETTNAGDDVMTSVTIEDNLVLGQKYHDPLSTTSVHGIFVGFQSAKSIIRHNKVIGTGLGIVVKGSNGDWADGAVYGNLVEDSFSYGIHFKGVNNCKCYNNTFNDNNREITFTANTGADEPTGIDVRNNILNNTLGYLYQFFSQACYDAINAIDYNVIYGTDNFCLVFETGVDLAAWNAKGYDLNSPTSDPKLKTSMIPMAGGSAIGAGETLDPAYDEGLDASTNWGDENTLPVVVTKQQTTPWDIGAYVS